MAVSPVMVMGDLECIAMSVPDTKTNREAMTTTYEL